jgi:thioredoxin:protein disulfide reductase
MKHLLLSILFFTSLFSNDGFLEPEKAFKTSITEKENRIEFKITLDKNIYVYDEFLKVSIIKPQTVDLTKELNIKEPVEHDGFKVHYNEVIIDVPKSLIKSKLGAETPYELKFDFQGCSQEGLCYSPMSKTFTSKGESAVTESKKETTTPLPAVNETDSIAATLQGGNVVLVLATFFGFGLLLAMTPCIFPMIPILSSIIVQQSNSQGGKMSAKQGLFLSIVYVLAMSMAYTIAGVLAGLFGANLQAMLQNPIVILVFAGIFVALAFSMFGYYEIGLPASWQSKLNKTSEEGSKKGGVAGVAIMGFLSALIVGPCVAPPLAGALIYIGQTGDAILGGAALFVMSLGMGVPLLLIGLGAGKYMPKPGGWMEQVTRIFGIVMLAIALWMLERIISDTLFMFLSSILLIGTAVYISTFKHLIVRTITAILFIYGTLIFIGALSGSTNVLDPLESLKGGGAVVASDSHKEWKHIASVTELDKIVSNSDKPIMIDFWASWCVSCKELDNITFKDERVINELSKYTIYKVDVTKNTPADKELMKKFTLFGPPALIFYENGKEITSKKIVGYKTPEEFLKIIR